MKEGCYRCVRYSIFAVNLSCMLYGGALLILAVWVRTDSRVSGFVNDEYYRQVDPAYRFDIMYVTEWLLVGVGVLCALNGFNGCCGAIRENRISLIIYAVMLCVLAFTKLGVMIWVFSSREQFENNLSDSFLFLVSKYGQSPEIYQSIMDQIQEGFRCCGSNNCGDYAFMGPAENWFPRSCDIRCDGCTYIVFRHLRDAFTIICIFTIGVVILEIAGCAMALWLTVNAGKRPMPVVRRVYEAASPLPQKKKHKDQKDSVVQPPTKPQPVQPVNYGGDPRLPNKVQYTVAGAQLPPQAQGKQVGYPSGANGRIQPVNARPSTAVQNNASLPRQNQQQYAQQRQPVGPMALPGSRPVNQVGYGPQPHGNRAVAPAVQQQGYRGARPQPQPVIGPSVNYRPANATLRGTGAAPVQYRSPVPVNQSQSYVYQQNQR